MKTFIRYLIESRSPLLNDLANVFSYDMVYNGYKRNDRPNPTLDTCQTIYRILNKWMFGNRLRDSILINVINSGRNQLQYAANYEFMYSAFQNRRGTVKLFLINEQHGIDPTNPCLNIVINGRPTLMYITNLLAHEMIHQYDIENANGLDKMLECIMNKTEYNPHGDVFCRFMNDSNDYFGLNIQKTATNVEVDQQKATVAARKTNDDFSGREFEDIQDIQMLNEYQPIDDDAFEISINSEDYSSFQILDDNIYKVQIS